MSIPNVATSFSSSALLKEMSSQELNKAHLFLENSEWLTTAEAAIYLRKISKNGKPSLNTVHQMVSRGLIRRRKFGGKLYFKKRELDYLIETSKPLKS